MRILDTTNPEEIAQFKSRLKDLYRQLQERNKIDKYVLIREDDLFPYDNYWIVNSNKTESQKASLAITSVLKERYALNKAGIKSKIGNINIPLRPGELEKALQNIDKDTGMVLMPTHFRSTKHFTINTPLSITGNYNGVSANRNFIIIDDISNFINSDYIYSIAPHDAYLDISHEPLEVSNKAIVLMNQDKLEKLKNDSKLMNELNNKNLVIFKGDETLAVDMVLTELGVLPSRVGKSYLDDNEDLIYRKTEEGLQELAKEKNIYYDRSHGGRITPDGGGHFSSYFDDKNNDWNKSLNELVEFLKVKFPNINITVNSLTNTQAADKLIDDIGNEELLINALKEYNNMVKNRQEISRKSYLEERKNISKEDSNLFKNVIRMIDSFYSNSEYNNYSQEELNEIEEDMRLFFQAPTLNEQLEKARIISRKIGFKVNEELQNMLNDNEETKENIETSKLTF